MIISFLLSDLCMLPDIFIYFLITIKLSEFTKNHGPKYFSHLTHKIFKFFTTLPVPVHKSSQAFKVTGPHTVATYAL